MARRVNTRFLIILTLLVGGGSLALIAIGKGVQHMRRDPAPFIQAAERHLQEGDLEQAARNYAQAASLSGRNPELRVTLGDLLVQLTREDAAYLARARHEWERALEIDPQYVPALNRLLDLYVDDVRLMPRADSAAFDRIRSTAERLVRIDPEDHRARAAYHIAALQSWQFGLATEPRSVEEAVQTLTALRAQAPQNADLPFFLAQERLHRAQDELRRNQPQQAAPLLAEAVALFDEPLEAQPDNAEMLWRAAQIHHAAGRGEATDQDLRRQRLERARELARQATRHADPQSPHYTELHLFAASILPQAPGDEAENVYRTLLAERPDDQDARLHIARYLVQFPATRDEAVRILEQPPVAGPDVVGVRALVHVRRQIDTLLELTDARLKVYAGETDPVRRERLMAGVEQGINRAQNQLGEVPAVLKLRGEMLLVRNQPVEAVQMLNRARSLYIQQNQQPDLGLLLSLARANIAVQQHGQAVNVLREVLARNNGYIQAHLMLAELLLRERRNDEARPHIDLLEQVMPDEPAVIKLRLATMNVATNLPEIEQYYARLPEQTPRQRLEKGQIALSAGMLEEAERLLTAVVQESPQDLQATELLVQLYMRRNQREEAMQVLAAAQQHQPDNQGLELLRQRLLEASPQELVQFVEQEIAKIPDEFARELQYAVLFRDTGDTERSFTHLSNAQRINADNPQLLELMFAHHVTTRQWDAARQYMERLARGNHDQAGGLLYRYRLAMARGDAHAAITIARDLTQRMPEFAQSWISLAQAQQATGQFESALTNYLRALEYQGSNFDALEGLVECYLALDRPEQARQQIARGRQVFPNHTFFIEQEINYELEYGDPDRALARLNELFEQNREQPEGWLMLARAEFRAGQLRTRRNQPQRAEAHFERARTLFAEALDQWPDEQAFYAYSLELALLADQRDEARRLLARFAAREPWQTRPEPHLLFADYYTRTNQPEEAEEALRQALRKSEENELPIRQRLANLLAQMQRIEAAVRILDAHRENPQVARQRIEILINGGQHEQAEDEIQAALAREPQAADLITLRGLAQLNLNHPADAIATLSRALEVEPDRPHTLYLRALGKLRLPQRDINGAIQDLIAARDRDGANIDFRLALAEAYQINDQPANAIRELTAALGTVPTSKPVRMRLIELHGAMARWPEVERLLRDARNHPQMRHDPDWLHAESVMWQTREDLDRSLALAEQAHQAAAAHPLYRYHYLSLLLQTDRHRRLLDETDELVASHAHTAGIHNIHQMRGIARRRLDDREGAMAEFRLALNAATAEQDEQAVLNIVNSIVREIGIDDALAHIGDRVERDDRWKLIAAQLHFSRGDHSLAIGMVEQVLSGIAQHSEAEQLGIFRVAASFYISAEPPQAEKAYENYLRLLEGAPQDAIALNNMAYLLVEYMDPPRPEEALGYSQRAYEQMRLLGVEEPLIMDTHGWVLTRAGRVDEGIAVLHQAADMRSFPEVHYHLGQAYLKRALADQARTQLQRAMELIQEREEANVPVSASLKQNVQRALSRAEELADAPPEASVR